MTSRLCQVRMFMLSAVLVVFTWAPTQAAVIDEVAADFKLLSGVVIMEKDGQYLVDLDAAKGISIGDLFSVVQPGEKIVHPVSGKVLGTLEDVKGIIKVTRLQAGYSFARALGKTKGIKRGDTIRRYENIPAVFWDYTANGEPFFMQLRNTMPNLKWQGYAAAQADRPKNPAAAHVDSPALLFILKKEGLDVRDSELQIIHAYGPPGSIPSAAAPTPKVPYALEKPQEKTKKGIAYEATFPGFTAVGDLPGAVVMADFVRDGDRLLLAATDGSAISVHGIGKDVSPLAEGDAVRGGQILSVQWWRPAEEAPLHLAVTALNDQEVEATIFTLKGNDLVPLGIWLPYFLGTFDLDGDGIPETLLRQSFDQDLFWGRQIRKLNLTAGKLRASRPDFKVPGSFTVLGSLFADLTGDGQLESVFVRGKELYIYTGKKQLYRSPPEIGGSLSVATYEVNPGAKDVFINSAMVEVSPAAADLDGDGRPELVVVASDRSFVGAPGIAPNIKGTRLAVVKYKDGMFVKGTLGEMLGKPVQGLAVTPSQLLFVATETGSIFGKKGSSHVLAYPLAQ